MTTENDEILATFERMLPKIKQISANFGELEAKMRELAQKWDKFIEEQDKKKKKAENKQNATK